MHTSDSKAMRHLRMFLRESDTELLPGRPARPSENVKFKSELICLHYIEAEKETSSDQYY